MKVNITETKDKLVFQGTELMIPWSYSNLQLTWEYQLIITKYFGSSE